MTRPKKNNPRLRSDIIDGYATACGKDPSTWLGSSTTYKIDKNVITRIIHSQPVPKRYAGVVALILGIDDHRWLLDHDLPPLANFKDYSEATFPKEKMAYAYTEKDIYCNRPSENDKPDEPAITQRNTITSPLVESGTELIQTTRKDVLPLPSQHQMNTTGDSLVGKWHCCHITRDKKGERITVQSEIVIDKSGKCIYEHGYLSLKYTGVLYFEGEDRFLMIYDSVGGKISERIVYRCKLPLQKNCNEIHGMWFGIDIEGKDTSSEAILIRKDSKDVAAEVNRDEEITTRLLFTKSPWLCLPSDPCNMNGLSVIKRWDSKLAFDSIATSGDEDTLNLLSTYFPEHSELYTTLVSRLKRLPKNKATEERMNIRLLYLDDNLKEMVEMRFQWLNEGHFFNGFHENIHRYEKLRKEYADVANICIIPFKSWPFAHYYQIGTKDMFFGIMLPHTSAVNGPMFHLKNSRSKLWEQMEAGFATVYEKSK